MLILIARAERKGGLDHSEGSRLRAGLQQLAALNSTTSEQEASSEASFETLRRRYDTARKRAWLWKRRAEDAGWVRGGASESVVDEGARDALHRVTALATRWTHIPAKRQAGASVLATIRNIDAT
ncbi:hypothetical protein ACIQHU_39465 [Streptomyces tendae]|uniref:hypothetical protein n=1 Tax=Streptomyces tendae TaxID=1932 RepID=UPI0038224DB1